ncbi:MAG: energy-coupling factor ABC transporter permease [Pseudomonadota bacterium]
MHIEAGVVDGAKTLRSYATAAGAAGVAAKLCDDDLKDNSATSFVARITVATALVFIFFGALPHYPVGVSEVHFILGTTLFLIFGIAPAALGLALGLLGQGALFVPGDLPHYFMTMTTLLVPLFGIGLLAKRIITPGTAYVDLTYRQALALSVAYQGGMVALAAFYGQGFGADNVGAMLIFGAAYAVVVAPIADLAVLAGAKAGRDLLDRTGLTHSRLHGPA